MLSKVKDYFLFYVKCYYELQKKRIHIEYSKPQVGFESLAKV